MANFPGPKHVAQVGAYIREQRENAQYSLRQLAQAAGVSNPYLSQIERGLRKPSAEILQQLAKALQISAETLYVRAGLLEPQDDADRADGPGPGSGSGHSSGSGDGAVRADGASAGPGSGGPAVSGPRGSRVIAAIRQDAGLTARQKQVLIDIYESYRAPAGAAREESADAASAAP